MHIVVIDQVGKLKNFQLLPSDEVCFFGSRTVKKGTLPKGEGETEGWEWGGGGGKGFSIDKTYCPM